MNDTRSQKITFLQALLIYLVAGYTASIRYISNRTADTAHQAAWLSPVCSIIIFIPFLYILYKVAKKFEGRSLYEILITVFGKIIGTFFAVILLLWLILLDVLYLKYAGENLVTTEFIGTDINLIIFIILLLVGVMLRWGISVISRMNKIIFILIMAQFIILVFFLFLHFRPDFITPISSLDVMPVLKSVVYPLTLWVYLTPLFIFNDQIIYDQKNSGKLIFTVGYLTIKNTLLILSLIGMLSYQLISKLKLPFYSAVENISVFKSTAGLDSLFLSIWMIAEFITVTYFTYCISRLIKNMFHLKNDVPVLTAILGFMMFFAIFFSSDMFQLADFSSYISPYLNLSIGMLIPLILFITAKIRRMV